MKKNNQNINVFDMASVVNKDLRANKIKTTNINILLNKVKLNKKEEIKKKLIFFFLLAMVITLVITFSLI
tara:strand:- start:902 stop:1111 length:210 start_codon:yes stop_codon:yes gene_type:complete